jgi:hypothetical protein
MIYACASFCRRHHSDSSSSMCLRSAAAFLAMVVITTTMTTMLLVLVDVVVATTAATNDADSSSAVEYGVDVVSTALYSHTLLSNHLLFKNLLLSFFSLLTNNTDCKLSQSFPMHHASVSVNYPWLPHNVQNDIKVVPEEYQAMVLQPLGNRQASFEAYIQGCVDHYGGNAPGQKGKRCLHNEESRVEMSLRQPKGMMNYTTTGFAKMRAPDNVFKLLQEFWQKNQHREKDEQWASGNVYVNHWHQPTGMVSVEDESMDGGGYVLKQHIVRIMYYCCCCCYFLLHRKLEMVAPCCYETTAWLTHSFTHIIRRFFQWNAARDTIQAWTGQRLAECSLYGIRVYKEGHMLAPHVDRLPLVSSAIINVDQDVDEPWCVCAGSFSRTAYVW